MANAHTVVNPFTSGGRRMMRNTQDTRWIAAGNGHVREQGQVSKGTSELGTPRRWDLSGSSASLSEGRSGHSTQSRATAAPQSLTRARPSTAPETGRSAGRSQKDAHSGKWYHVAREIYKMGPQGEGEEMWKAIRAYCTATRRVAGAKQDAKTRADSRPPCRSRAVCSNSASRSPNTAAASGPPRRPPRPDSLPVSVIDSSIGRTSPRKHLHVSRSSGELQIGIDRSIQPFVDVNKPLPAIPPQDIAAKVCSQKDHHKSRSFISSWRFKNRQRLEGLGVLQHLPWSASSADRQTVKAHDALKAKISRPQPVAARDEDFMANGALEGNSVEEPTGPLRSHAEDSMIETPRRSHEAKEEARGAPPRDAGEQVERKKEKQKASQDMLPVHWREKLVSSAHAAGRTQRRRKEKKKRSSDVSFACAGLSVAATQMHDQGSGSGRYVRPGEQVDGVAGFDELVPESLFSGKRVDGYGKGTPAFYQPWDNDWNGGSNRVRI